jgi:SulP family sulfate permease
LVLSYRWSAASSRPISSPVESGFPIEQQAPEKLASNEVTMLYAYGSLVFAAATAFENKLPSADEAQHPVVILLLRGRPEVGSTFIGVLRRYSDALRANGGRLKLAGASTRVSGWADRYVVATPQLFSKIGSHRV